MVVRRIKRFRITHKEWDLREDCTYSVCIRKSMGASYNLFLLNHLISHWKTMINADWDYHILKSFRSSLQSHSLWVTLYLWEIANNCFHGIVIKVFTVDISGVEVNFHFKQKFQPLVKFFEEIESLSQTLIL